MIIALLAREWCVTPWEIAMKSRLTTLASSLAALAALAATLSAGMRWLRARKPR
jgi:hypothetical protein